MDYKYIEQLLERYWAAETTEAEEQILRTFFSQPDVPAALARYRDLFAYEQQQAAETLGEDFDERLCSLVEAPVVKARRVSFLTTLRPLYQAAAAVAIVVLVGIAAQHSFNGSDEAKGWDYNPASYSDTYSEPQQAYSVVETGIGMFRKTAAADSAKAVVPNPVAKGGQER